MAQVELSNDAGIATLLSRVVVLLGLLALVRGLARGLGIEEPVTSPSFTLMHEYAGPVPLYHLRAGSLRFGGGFVVVGCTVASFARLMGLVGSGLVGSGFAGAGSVGSGSAAGGGGGAAWVEPAGGPAGAVATRSTISVGSRPASRRSVHTYRRGAYPRLRSADDPDNCCGSSSAGRPPRRGNMCSQRATA